MRLCIFRGGRDLLLVDAFAHNKTGTAYQDKSRRLDTVVDHSAVCLRSVRADAVCCGGCCL
jgi:hypothetical protein